MKNKLLNAILRSEMAYGMYIEDKRFFQAVRIYKANQLIYELLQDFLLITSGKVVEDVIMYIFHLEDWFAQFEVCQCNVETVDEMFVFDRLDGAVSYPLDFKKKLKSIKL